MNYDHFDRSHIAAYPRKTGAYSTRKSSAFPKKSLVLSVSLFCLGVFAASVVVNSFTAAPVADESLPLVKAEVSPFRELPINRGGMIVPNHESTVFTTMRAGTLAEQAPMVEPAAGDASLERLKAFAAEADTKLEQTETPVNLLDPVPMDQDAGPVVVDAKLAAKATQASAETPAEEPVVSAVSEDSPAPARKPEVPQKSVEVAKPAPVVVGSGGSKIENLLAEAPTPDQSSLTSVVDDQPKVVVSNEKIPPKLDVAHSSNSAGFQKPEPSSETLAFVRSVLDKKDTRAILGTAPQKQPEPQVVEAAPVPSFDRDVLVSNASSDAQAYDAAAAMEASRQAALQTESQPGAPQADALAVASIEPAAGMGAGEVRYYVQLSSVPSEGAAEGEWSKLQASFSDSLTGQPHRVARADLGERGVYYRIQAGPYSKDSASSLCERIKAQKPGGCLVVQ